MIRASDLASATGWIRPSTATPRADNAQDPSSYFDAGAVAAGARISSDVPASARSLSVEQHASLVLAHLRDERDDQA